MDHPTILSLYFPFVFSEAVDPRSIFTVGDQVLAEHLFGFHARLSAKSGFEDFASVVRFDPANSEVTISPKYQMRRADGTEVEFTQICHGLESSLQGTQHAPYSTILKGLRCDSKSRTASIHFKSIPVNLRFLFTVPDFSIFDPSDLPIKPDNGTRATGPYSLESLTRERAVLRRNPYYPSKLVSNTIEQVQINRYDPGNVSSFIHSMDTKHQHGAYFFGYSVSTDDISQLKAKGYNVTVSPTEWFVYITTKKSVPESVRSKFATAVERFKMTPEFRSSLGEAATSIAPADREYALTSKELAAVKASHVSRSSENESKPMKIATLETWAGIPFFASVLKFMEKEFPGIEIQLLPPNQIGKLFTNEVEVALCPLGISPTDPLTHFSFLANTLAGFSEVVSPQEIAEAAVIADGMEFNNRIKEFERRTVESGFLLPLAHFPGVVAIRSDFRVNESTSFGWGIQAWSMYQD